MKNKSEEQQKEDKISNDKLSREIFFENRDLNIKDFTQILCDCRDGSENRDFAIARLFNIISEQESFIEWVPNLPHKYTSVKKEKEILESFIKKAKEVFGKDYDVCRSKYSNK
jgi:hypothetical protein